MTPTTLPTLQLTIQAVPLALMFTTRLLLAEKSASLPEAALLPVCVETLRIRATKVTAILKNIPGYSHGGIND